MKLPVLKIYSDGSYRSVLVDTIERQRVRRARLRGRAREPLGISVRVVEYRVTGRPGSGETIRLITTILDVDAVSAPELATAYAQRWEFEISLAELEIRQRGPGRVLRSQTPQMTRQEIWGMLLVHYAVRVLMWRVVADQDADPDRVSFIRSLRIIRRHVTTQAALFPLSGYAEPSARHSPKSANDSTHVAADEVTPAFSNAPADTPLPSKTTPSSRDIASPRRHDHGPHTPTPKLMALLPNPGHFMPFV